MIEHELRESYRYGHDGAGPFGVLVSSVGAKVPLLEVVRAAMRKLGNAGKLWGGDFNPNCIGRSFVDRFWRMPALAALEPQVLIDICLGAGIRCIIPTRDGELAFYARHLSALKAAGVAVMVSSAQCVETCLDKLRFAEVLRAKGYPAIETAGSIGVIDADSYVVKERCGAGAKKVALRVPHEEARQHASTLSSPIFQPYVAGTEFSIDVYVDRNGRPHGAVARRRELVVRGESQITTTCRDEQLTSLCQDIACYLGIRYHAVLQVLVDGPGRYRVIECNSRFGGASSLSVAVGLDSFYWFLLEATGSSLREHPFARAAGEKRQIRYAVDKVIDLLEGR